MTTDYARSVFRTYGIPAPFWGEKIGLSLTPWGMRLVSIIDHGELDNCLAMGVGIHFHGATRDVSLLPLFCRAMLIREHKAYYRRVEDVSSFNTEDDPEEFARQHLDALIMCIDSIDRPPPDEDVWRFELRVRRWLATGGIIFTAARVPLTEINWWHYDFADAMAKAVTNVAIEP